MAIRKEIGINIVGEKATFSKPFYIYQFDRGVELYINVMLDNEPILVSFGATQSGATVMKPNGQIIGQSRTPVDGDYMSFLIDSSFTDELNEIGTYMVQFHLYDDNDNRYTIPPVPFEVKELVGIASGMI